MEENTLTILSLLCLGVGFIGSFMPVLPGTILSWIGLVIFKYTSIADYGWTTLIIAALLVAIVQGLNYFLPAYGSKRFGGSRYGIMGASIGLLIGIIFSPFGFVSIIIMPFVGAYLGELLFNKKTDKNPLKSAFGTFVGFMMSTGLSMLLSLAFLGYVLWQISMNTAWNIWHI